ncbi:MAG: condensation domain-containing protein, partial [Verrucomicrobiota bacterium]
RFESGEFADICQSSRTLSPARREPRSALEHQLHAIWSAVLGVEMGLDESFFELGGNSLLATQILSRLREQFQVDLPFPTLFEENSTIAGMARSIESRRGERKPPFQIPKARPDEPLPLSFAQERLWFLDQLHPHSGLYHVRVALHLQGSPNVQALSKSLQYLAQRHEIFRTRFKVRAGRPVQVILPTDTISLETVTGNGAAGSDLHECLQQITLPSRHPLDLEHGPLWKAQWFSLQEQHHLLVLIFHQMAIDGWSLGLVLDELAQVYSAIEGQREPELKPLPIQGADFAVWQRQQPTSAEALAFWQHELRAPWPKGRLRSNNTSAVPCAGPAITLIYRVERDLVESIRGLCQQESLTPFMIFLGAFAATLEPFLTENELIIGTPIAGRHHVETERMVGFLVNTLALRLAIDSNKTVHAWLRQIRQTVLNAFQHAEAPFEKVIETVNPKRDGSNPLIRFWIGSIDLPDALSAGGLKMLAEPLPNSHAQFDLSLFIHSHPTEWKVVFEGNSDVIDRAGLERFQRLFCALLRRLTLDPEKTISTLLRESAEAADAGPSNAPSAFTS